MDNLLFPSTDVVVPFASVESAESKKCSLTVAYESTNKQITCIQLKGILTTFSTQDILNNLFSTDNFYVTNAFLPMTIFFLNDASKLFRYFTARQFPFSDNLHYFNTVKLTDRRKLLSHTPKQQHNNICLITIFIPKIDIFIHSTKSNYYILKDDGKIGGIFVQPPIYASTQPPNLRHLLIRNTITDNKPECNKPCGKHRCKVCKHINTATNVLINNKTANPGNYKCDSANVVYLIH